MTEIPSVTEKQVRRRGEHGFSALVLKGFPENFVQLSFYS